MGGWGLGFKGLSLSLCCRSTWVSPPRNYSMTSREGLTVSWLSRTDTTIYQLIYIISWFWQPFLMNVKMWRNRYKYISDELIKSIDVNCPKIKKGVISCFNLCNFATCPIFRNSWKFSIILINFSAAQRGKTIFFKTRQYFLTLPFNFRIVLIKFLERKNNSETKSRPWKLYTIVCAIPIIRHVVFNILPRTFMIIAQNKHHAIACNSEEVSVAYWNCTCLD